MTDKLLKDKNGAKVYSKKKFFFLNPNNEKEGEKYYASSKRFADAGDKEKSMEHLFLAINCYELASQTLVAAQLSEKLVKILVNEELQSELFFQIQRTVNLYMSQHYVDYALEFLAQVFSLLLQRFNIDLASKVIDVAINIAEMEERKILAKKFNAAKLTLKDPSEAVKEYNMVAKNVTKHWNVIKNNGDNADSNNRATNSKTEITKNAIGDNSKENNQSFALKEAFDSTIIPLSLSAAVYSGVGGYSAIRPGLVGLTPGQLREMRKYGEDQILNEEARNLMSSDV